MAQPFFRKKIRWTPGHGSPAPPRPMAAIPNPTPAAVRLLRKASARLRASARALSLGSPSSFSTCKRKDIVWAGLKTAKSSKVLYTKTARHRKLAFIYLVSKGLRCKNSTSSTSMADGGSGAPNYRRFLA